MGRNPEWINGPRLKELRKAKGWTQQEAAERLQQIRQVDRAPVEVIKRAESNYGSVDVAAELAQIYGVEVEQLISNNSKGVAMRIRKIFKGKDAPLTVEPQRWKDFMEGKITLNPADLLGIVEEHQLLNASVGGAPSEGSEGNEVNAHQFVVILKTITSLRATAAFRTIMDGMANGKSSEEIAVEIHGVPATVEAMKETVLHIVREALRESSL